MKKWQDILDVNNRPVQMPARLVNRYCFECDNFGRDGMNCLGDKCKGYAGMARPVCFTQPDVGHGQDGFDAVIDDTACRMEDAPAAQGANITHEVDAASPPFAVSHRPARPRTGAAGRLLPKTLLKKLLADRHPPITPAIRRTSVTIILFCVAAFAPVKSAGGAFATVAQISGAFAPVKVFSPSGANIERTPAKITNSSTDYADSSDYRTRRDVATDGRRPAGDSEMVSCHPAGCDDVAKMLGVDRRAVTRKITGGEELFEILIAGCEKLTTTGRPDRVLEAIRNRLRTIYAIARNGQPEDFETWFDNYFAGRRELLTTDLPPYGENTHTGRQAGNAHTGRQAGVKANV